MSGRAAIGLAALAAVGCSRELPARHVTISPLAPTTLDDLVATAGLSADDQATFELFWSRDGEPVPEALRDRVPARLTARGEVWTVDLVESGRGASPALVATASVEIRNAPPRIARLSLDPPDPRADDRVMLVAGEPVDPDGDEIVLRADWFLDGEPVATGVVLPPNIGASGQRLEVRAAPFDGLDEGPERRVDSVMLREAADPVRRWAIANGTSCYLAVDGRAACWGHAFGADPAPRFVGGSLRFRAIAAGWSLVCGVDLGGDLWCWGAIPDGSGALVITAEPERFDRPSAVAFQSVAADAGAFCALDSEGVARCAGASEWGILDEIDLPSRDLIPIAGLPAIGSLDLGPEHACAVAADGAAWCWGSEHHGRLGRAALGSGVSPPAPIDLVRSWRAVSAGLSHTCGLDDGRAAWCWGSNAEGQLGTGVGPTDRGPGRVLGGHRWLWLDAGARTTCGVRDDETLWCWGDNVDGLVGDGTRTSREAPVTVGGPGPWRSVAVGRNHACADRADGSLWCWGRNRAGEVGDGTTDHRAVPTRVGVPAEPDGR